ncbi:MAG: SGNH/GDSL hydrolase family protein [Clostridia bacterium]|nr:SGNH/GDSL hydrolase family protein [Clostridia bacterium]
MKKIVLIGDSIRMGYDKYVKDALVNSVEVFYPQENCRFAEYVLRYAHEWRNNGEWGDDVDLVHWNAGLWDVLELFGDEPLTSISYYGETITRIDKRLRMLFPKAKFVFATSTNVSEKMSDPDFTRHNATIEKYNAEALRALSGTDTVINDLYSLTSSVPDSYRSDWVHFYTPEGTELIGGKVLSVICDLLDIAPTEVNIENFHPERYSKETIGY